MSKWQIFLMTLVMFCSLGFPVSAICAQQAPIAKLIDQARQNAEAGNFDAAVSNLQSILKIDPDHAEANYQLGRLYVRRSDLKNAVLFFKKSVSANPDSFKARSNLALVYERLHRIDAALNEYSAVISIAPSSKEGRRALKRLRLIVGKRYIRAKNFDRASQLLTVLLDKYGSDVEVLNYVAITYSLMKRLDDAEAVFKRVIKEHPNHPDAVVAHANLAQVYKEKGDKERRFEQLQRVISLGPDTPRGHKSRVALGLERGQYFFEQHRFDEGYVAIQKALDINPNNVMALITLGLAQFQDGQYALAEETLNRSILLDQSNQQAHHILARVYADSEQPEKAIEQLLKVVELGEGQSSAARQSKMTLIELYVRLGNEKSRNGKLEEGGDYFKKALELAPNNAGAKFNLALNYSQRGMLDEALDEFKSVLLLTPEDVDIYVNLAKAYLQKSEQMKAFEQYAIAISLEKDEERAGFIVNKLRTEVAKSIFNQGELDRAEKEYLSISKAYPDEFIAYLYLGLIETRRDHFEEAIAYYTKVIALSPQHIGAHFNLAVNNESISEDSKALAEYRHVIEKARGRLKELAQRRLDNLQRRIRPFSHSMSYQLTLDDNSNLNPSDPVFEYRTDLFYTLSYRKKLSRERRYNINFSPSYSTYHVGNFDFLSYSVSATATQGSSLKNFSIGYTLREQNRLLRQERLNKSTSYSLSGVTRVNLPQLMFGENVSTVLNGGLRYTQQVSSTAQTIDSDIYSLNFSLRQPVGDNRSATFGYRYSDNDTNRDTVLGSDYSNVSHTYPECLILYACS